MESAIKSYDPLAYWVDVVSGMDPKIVRVHREKDTATKKELLSLNKGDFDIFICVNKASHAFVLCSPVNAVPEGHPLKDSFSDDPFKIPGLLLCWTFELCFENQKERWYKIKNEYEMFKDIKRRIKQSFYMGRYTEVSPNALQFAVLSAAPHRYNAIISDCVEFSKEFCLCLVSYCANWRVLEDEVNKKIKKVSATGLSVERLSRQVQSSGLMGYSLFTGIDTSTLFSGRHGVFLMIAIGVFFLVYPIVVAVVIAKLL